eukprot:TRINITY_DN2429_c0_g7_i2.p1 TRINITY_DN2429_c0_g7~~TRINITY_DN2429_c0_g7_i2.p1  ORF type:complete len:554 (-),score=112.83 TRINITY_DN2429_c0_g7_i2:82-1743(-)
MSSSSSVFDLDRPSSPVNSETESISVGEIEEDDICVTYDLKRVNHPKLTGFSLRMFASSLEASMTNWALIPKLKVEAGFQDLVDSVCEESPTPAPLHYALPQGSVPTETFDFYEWENQALHKPKSYIDYYRAYTTGAITPTRVAHDLINMVRKSNEGSTPLRAIIKMVEGEVLVQAAASTERYQRGAPLSPIDGVPICVKDEIDMLPYATSAGTNFLLLQPQEDGTSVARLRRAGALLFGKAAMHELSVGVSGNNPHFGSCRNPYNMGHYAGGSSSGSASAIGVGLCPISLGTDSGGSIRVPAAYCGVVGLKPTYGRISSHGTFPLSWSTTHVGVLGATAMDCAVAYSIVAGPDPEDVITSTQPPVTFYNLSNKNLSGITIGIYRPYFEDAQPEIVACCKDAVNKLEAMGADVKEILIPNLNLARIAHLAILLSEVTASTDLYYKKCSKLFNADSRILLATARTLTGVDYIKSQKLRTKAIHHILKILKKVDVIVTPSSAITAPHITPSALSDGESDNATATEAMRFSFLAAFTGLSNLMLSFVIIICFCSSS